MGRQNPGQALREAKPSGGASLDFHGDHGRHCMELPSFAAVPEAVPPRSARGEPFQELFAGGPYSEARTREERRGSFLSI